MEKISIKTSGINVIKPIGHKKETKHTNPFGLSFKGNVIQADIFDSSKSKVSNSNGVIEKITDKSRAFKSAVVGGINNFNTKLNTRFNNGINRIVSFGKKIGHDTKEFIKKANSTYVIFDINNLSGTIKQLGKLGSKVDNYDVKHLVKRPVSELEEMLTKELAGIRG